MKKRERKIPIANGNGTLQNKMTITVIVDVFYFLLCVLEMIDLDGTDFF